MKHIPTEGKGRRQFVWISIVVILLVALFIFFPFGKEDATEETIVEEQTISSEQTTRQSYNDVIFNEEIEFDEFPFFIKQELDELFTYEVYFETDEQIQFVVYSEERYNMWKESGMHTISKASTKSGPVCCNTAKTFIVEINENEGGLYYFLFDDSNLPDKENLPTKGKLKITKKTSV